MVHTPCESHTVNIIWQTQNGQQTQFELDYLRDVIFKKVSCTPIFDEGKCQADADHSIIVYSSAQVVLDPILRDYFQRHHSFGLIHLSEERLNHEKDYYKKARFVLRSYHDPRISDDHVFSLPLGFQSGYLNKDSDIDFDAKNLVWSFAGQVKSNRRPMIKAFSKLKPHKLVLTKVWADPNGLSVSDMAEVYRRSIFAPCPFGNRNPDSFRIMEALEYGCIPVSISFLGEDYFKYIFGDHPFLIASTWSDALKEMNYLLDHPTLLRERQLRVWNWYQNFKEDLSHDIADIVAGKNSIELRSKQFFYQKQKPSLKTLLLYNLYYGRGFVRRVFRFFINKWC